MVAGGRNDVFFEHHTTFESFEEALSLPCAICSFAYAHDAKPPTALDWTTLMGHYLCLDHGRQLYFYQHDDRRLSNHRRLLNPSARLSLVPDSSEW